MQVHVRAYSAPLRAVAASLYAIAALNVLNVAAHILRDMVEGTRSAPPLAIGMSVLVLSGAPLLAAAILRRAVAATVDVDPERIVITMRRARFEIPAASIQAVRPLRMPIPEPGVALEMKSGRRFHHRLTLADPSVLLEALFAAPGHVAVAAGAVRRHPAVLYADAKHRIAPRRWYWLALKLVVFPLVVSIIVFRLHQVIGYGGAFGQYHRLGLASYLGAFAVTCAGTMGGLWVYIALWRLAGEAFALVATWAFPRAASVVRVLVEALSVIVSYGFVSAYLVATLLF